MRIAQLQQLIFGSLLAVVALTAGGSVWLRSAVRREAVEPGLPEVAVAAAEPLSAEVWPGAEVWAGPDTMVMSEEAGRYKLAGTFGIFGSGEAEGETAALLDDTGAGVQRVVRVGDAVGDFRVAEITLRRLTLERAGRRWVLALSGELASGRTPVAPVSESAPVRWEDLPAIETTPYGKKVMENRWVLDRAAVKAYIDEMTRPVNMMRTAQLYRSFDQVAVREEDEPGYRIGMKGEQAFFQAMGLRDGDVIRKVNSMKMRNQQRAEYLVKEFYRERMSAVVLDVERDGEVEQLIYLVR